MHEKAHMIRRTLTAIVLGATVAAVIAPAAHANNRIVDDWFRDARHAQATPQAVYTLPDRLVEKYSRHMDGVAAQTSDRIVDDWFRDGRSVTVTPLAETSSDDGFDWKGVGIAGIVVLMLVGVLGLGVHTVRHATHRLGNV